MLYFVIFLYITNMNNNTSIYGEALNAHNTKYYRDFSIGTSYNELKGVSLPIITFEDLKNGKLPQKVVIEDIPSSNPDNSLLSGFGDMYIFQKNPFDNSMPYIDLGIPIIENKTIKYYERYRHTDFDGPFLVEKSYETTKSIHHNKTLNNLTRTTKTWETIGNELSIIFSDIDRIKLNGLTNSTIASCYISFDDFPFLIINYYYNKTDNQYYIETTVNRGNKIYNKGEYDKTYYHEYDMIGLNNIIFFNSEIANFVNGTNNYIITQSNIRERIIKITDDEKSITITETSDTNKNSFDDLQMDNI